MVHLEQLREPQGEPCRLGRCLKNPASLELLGASWAPQLASQVHRQAARPQSCPPAAHPLLPRPAAPPQHQARGHAHEGLSLLSQGAGPAAVWRTSPACRWRRQRRGRPAPGAQPAVRTPALPARAAARPLPSTAARGAAGAAAAWSASKVRQAAPGLGAAAATAAPVYAVQGAARQPPTPSSSEPECGAATLAAGGQVVVPCLAACSPPAHLQHTRRRRAAQASGTAPRLWGAATGTSGTCSQVHGERLALFQGSKSRERSTPGCSGQ